ncbi:MAG TPA: hypothetical protein VD962_11105 [Rubricoccaceae bacterium]|nr:hypothetical protein [Rubricoccaceae bacterium]
MPTTDVTSSVEEQLKALVRLQHFDSRIDQLNKLRGDLPDEIRDLEDEKAGLETRVENANTEAQENEARRKKLKLDMAESEALIRKYEEQQLQVRNNREYDALTKEIEAQRQRIQAANEETEERTQRDAANEEAVAAARERLAELEEILVAKRAELERVVSDTRHETEAYEGKREAAREHIEPRVLRAYDRLRQRVRDGRAVVPIERGAAAGYTVPPQRQVEIRLRNRIIVSEHDGRIIVDDQLYRETLEALEREEG